jgi:microcystin-dependent protein
LHECELDGYIPITSPVLIHSKQRRAAETPFWSESMPKVPVSNGLFSVTLGATLTNPIDPSKFRGDTYIGIKVGLQSEMTPRQKMTSVPYALNGVPFGVIVMWSGAVNQVPAGWVLCDGNNGTPDLRDRFIVGAGREYSRADNGGEKTHTITTNEMPSHSHDVDPPATNTGGQSTSHNHYYVGKTSSPEAIGYGLTTSSFVDRVIVTGDSYSGSNSSDHNHAVDIPQFNSGRSGGSQAFENRPPYYALAFIMKL